MDELVPSRISRLNVVAASVAPSIITKAETLAASELDTDPDDTLTYLPVNLTVGTKLICLGFDNRIDCSSSLPSIELSGIGATLLKRICRELKSDKDTFRCLTIVLVALTYLLVLLERCHRDLVKRSSSMTNFRWFQCRMLIFPLLSSCTSVKKEVHVRCPRFT